MQIILETDEAWSLMTVISSYAIDNGGMAQAGKQAVRQWRAGHAQGTPAMAALTEGINAALGGYLDDKTNRQIRRKGRYSRKQEPA